MESILKVVKSYWNGKNIKCPLIWHKKPHNTGEFACIRGIREICDSVVDCKNTYSNKTESYCLNDGQSNGGFLAIEPKHQKLIDTKKFGAYTSLRNAMNDLIY